MDSQDPSIEEKLVPFVEGALAEADRREVMQALPSQPALNAEVRQLREAILLLRKQADRGMTYRHPVETAAEQVVDYVVQGDRWSRQAERMFQLALLESPDLREEVEILRELEQDLQQRVEAARPIPEMPGALRAAIQETYGKPAQEPAWKRSLGLLAIWLSGINLRVASAAIAGLVVVVGGVSLGRLTYQRLQSSETAQSAAAGQTGSATPAAAPAATASAADAAPAGQVAVLDRKVHPEDLPRLSRILWQKQVSHSYRDGQIFVAKADLDRAWEALALNERVASARPLKTGPVPEEKKPNPLQGIIGMLPDVKQNKPAPKVKESPAAAAAAGPAAEPKRDQAPPSGVAIHLPEAPEVSRQSGGDDANYNVLDTRVAPAQAQAPATHAAEPAPAPRPAPARSTEPVPSVAPAPVPTRAARPAPPARVVDAAPRQMARLPQAPAPAQDPSEVERHRVAPAPRPAPAVAPPLQPIAPRPAARPTGAVAAANTGGHRGVGARPENRNEGLRTEEPRANTPRVAVAEPTNPAPIEAPAAPVLRNQNEQVAEEPDTRPRRPLAAVRQERPNLAAAASPTQAPLGMRQVPKLSELRRENAKADGFTAVDPAAPAASAYMSKGKDPESFDVPAGAPFEVAMLPVAKKLVQDLIGEAKVQMERKDDGHLLVTIRPERSLTPQEVEKLRKVVREKLELKDEDTVVIRQP